MFQYYRPPWTCGRYHQASRSAIMYNLKLGYSFFFEEESAIIIGWILKKKRLHCFKAIEISNQLGISLEDLTLFLSQLSDFGLLCSNGSSSLNNKYEPTNYAENPTIIDSNCEYSFTDAEVEYSKRTNCRIIEAVIELTYSCSEKCIHCYNPGATRNDKENSSRDTHSLLSLSDYKRIIDELIEEGLVKICLTGGDPFSYRDSWSVIEYLYEKEIATVIFTNGQGLIGKVDKLAQYFPLEVSLSIYSTKAEVHDRITRIKGSLQRSLSVLEELSKYQIALTIKCCLMRQNFKDYPLVYELAKKFKANIQIDPRIFDSAEGDRCVSKYLRLTPQQLEIVLFDSRCNYHVSKDLDNYGAYCRDFKKTACLTGFNDLCITPEGFVIPCVCFHMILGDLKNQHIKDIVYNNELINEITSTTLEDYKGCGQYPYCSFCFICPGLNYSERGDMRLPAENSCYFAKARYNLAEKIKKGEKILLGEELETVLHEIDSQINYNEPQRFFGK